MGEIGVLALAVDGETHRALDSGRERLRLFRSGRYETSFPLDSSNVHFGYPTSNVFAGTGELVVIPAHPDTGFLAMAYHRDGTLLRGVGELPPETAALREPIPGADDTFCPADGRRRIAIHKFTPLVRIFDDQFMLTHRFRPDSPVIVQGRNRVDSFKPSPEQGLPMPVFIDAKLHDGTLYLMSTGHLHRLDAETGEARAIYPSSAKVPTSPR